MTNDTRTPAVEVPAVEVVPYRSDGLTVGDMWEAVSGRPIDRELLRWPPDAFAFSSVLLERTEAYRFAVSPPEGWPWPPMTTASWEASLTDAARDWWQSVRDGCSDVPDLVLEQWATVAGAIDTPLEQVASGDAWPICVALLTLHAVSDEACATAIAAHVPANETDVGLRARVRELLARTGSMATIPPGVLRVLPRYRTPSGGISSRSISRYACVVGPAVDVSVHQIGRVDEGRHRDELNIVLLPWPLQVQPDDFRPIAGSVREREVEPFGYFAFEPSGPLDTALVDRLLERACEQVETVDIVVLPECAVGEDDLPPLEAVMAKHGIDLLIAGVRERASSPDAFTSNWIQYAGAVHGQWWHYRQDKHHRWSLDRSQIEQYHLEDVLEPRVRWWEAMAVRRRAVQLLERGDGSAVASLVCEDIAHFDEVVDVLRATAPNLLVTLLLDGPQLETRWAARYAAVLTDDPGSAVLTLSSFGMVQRAWRRDLPPSPVVALWKDRDRGVHEIGLEPGAQAILIQTEHDPTIRRAADGRSPTADVSDLRLATVSQLRATDTGAETGGQTQSTTVERPPMSAADLTVALGWADAAAAVSSSPEQLNAVIDDARTGAAWRDDLRLPQPQGALASAMDTLTPRPAG
jgi:hypothetical protein